MTLEDDPQALEAQRRKEKQARQDLEQALRAVMGTRAGRHVVWHLLDEVAGVFGGSYVADAGATAFNEGRRAVGLDLLREVQAVVPKAYLEMLGEALGRIDAVSPPPADNVPGPGDK